MARSQRRHAASAQQVEHVGRACRAPSPHSIQAEGTRPGRHTHAQQRRWHGLSTGPGRPTSACPPQPLASCPHAHCLASTARRGACTLAAAGTPAAGGVGETAPAGGGGGGVSAVLPPLSTGHVLLHAARCWTGPHTTHVVAASHPTPHQRPKHAAAGTAGAPHPRCRRVTARPRPRGCRPGSAACRSDSPGTPA